MARDRLGAPALERALERGLVPEVVWRFLDDAVASARDTIASSPDCEWTAAVLAEHAERICALVRGSAEGGPPVSLRGIPPVLPTRRLVELARRAFVERVGLDGDATTALAAFRILAAFEDAQRAVDADHAERLAQRLSGVHGIDLIVEVAHDMRSPLGSILFLAERLRRGQSGVVNAIQERQLGLVYSAAFGLSTLASDVIELARGGDRLIDRPLEAFSVAAILAGVRDIVLPIAEEKGLTLSFAGPDADLRMGHPAALNRVLLNLTTNALKFTPAGSVAVEVRALTRSRVRVSVQDTGRGIPDQVLATLFDPFRRRVKPGEYAFSSAGLGLAICDRLIAGMGGKLAVDTAVEKGTRFHFELDLPSAPKL